MAHHFEAPREEMLKSAIEGLVVSVQNELISSHQLNPLSIPDIKNSLLAGYSPEQVTSALADMGINIEGGLGPAGVFSLPHEPGAANIDQVVWLDVQHPDIAGLTDVTDANFEQHLQGILIATEEVSHYIYIHSYFQQHGVEPPHWMQEMIAALDKYVAMQKRYVSRYSSSMTPEQESMINQDIFRAINHPQAPEEHRVGQSRAYSVKLHLNNLFKQGNQAEANSLEGYLYQSHEDDVKKLFAQS